MSRVPLNGLVLAGGESRRMGRDKAALQVNGRTALERVHGLASLFCERVFVSVRPGGDDALRARFERVEDLFGGAGPADGIASAQSARPGEAWLVLACDLPRLDETTLRHLVSQRDPSRDATAYRSATAPDLPEPLCAIYEPSSATHIERWLGEGLRCPRKMLLNLDTLLLDSAGDALDNMNTPEDWARFHGPVS